MTNVFDKSFSVSKPETYRKILKALGEFEKGKGISIMTTTLISCKQCGKTVDESDTMNGRCNTCLFDNAQDEAFGVEPTTLKPKHAISNKSMRYDYIVLVSNEDALIGNWWGYNEIDKMLSAWTQEKLNDKKPILLLADGQVVNEVQTFKDLFNWYEGELDG